MIKRCLLFLALTLPLFGQVSTQKVVNTAVIYSANSPVTFGANFTGLGADYLLNAQTLTGNGSILTRSLGDARYAAIANGFDTNSSYIYATGTTQSFYNIIVRGDATVLGTTSLSNVTFNTPFNVVNATNFPPNVVVTNGAQFISGVKTFRDSLFITNGVLTVSTQDPTINLFSTNATGQRSVQFTDLLGASAILGVSRATGQFFPGNPTETFLMRATSGGAIALGIGTTRGYFYNGTSHTFEVGNVIVSNNFTVVGNSTFKNGFTGSITNMSGLGTSNVVVYASGVLTNRTTIP